MNFLHALLTGTLSKCRLFIHAGRGVTPTVIQRPKTTKPQAIPAAFLFPMQKPFKPCSKPGCGTLTHGRYCDKHEHTERQRAEQARGTSAQRLYGYRWQQARAAYIAAHSLCVMCLSEGRTTATTVVDHIVPHRGDPILFWDQDNWQSLCTTCHNSTKQRQERAG